VDSCWSGLATKGGIRRLKPSKTVSDSRKDKPNPAIISLPINGPFKDFNWTDHEVDVGNRVRYRVTAMIDDSSGSSY